MKKNLLFILILTILGLNNLFSQSTFNQTDTVDIVMSEGKGMDAVTSSLYPNDVYDWEEKIQAYAWTQGGQLNVTRAFLNFDFSSVPSNLTIVQAVLILHNSPILGHYGDNTCFVNRIIDNWGDSTLTHNNQPNVSSLNQVTIPATTSSTQPLFEIDVTSMTQDMFASPNILYGYRIRLETEFQQRSLVFSSSESTDPSKRPILRIITSNNIAVNNNDLNITISPNPVANHLKIDGFNNGSVLAVQIYSMIGQLVYTDNQFDANQTLDVSSIENGFYILKITNNGETISKKILIQK